MSHFQRTLGLIRSLLIYHAVPGRQRRLRRLYRRFVNSGDLVFDLGAHVGNHTRALASLGCHVIAVDPQPDCANTLRLLYRKNRQVDVVQAAVSDTSEQVQLAISERHPTLTTTKREWRADRERDPLFEGIRWNSPISVRATTLDGLIEQYGTPSFVKIDVEGAELTILSGLSHPIQTVSIEYLPNCVDETKKCIARLSALGPYQFNWSKAETFTLAEKAWLTDSQLLTTLKSSDAQSRSGDVYAQLIKQ